MAPQDFKATLPEHSKIINLKLEITLMLKTESATETSPIRYGTERNIFVNQKTDCFGIANTP